MPEPRPVGYFLPMKSLAAFKAAGRLALSLKFTQLPGAGDQHLFYEHTPVWAYCNPALANPYAPELGLPDVFGYPLPGTTISQAAGLTKFLVFIGAGPSPQFRQALADPGLRLLVFEPDPARLEAFLAGEDQAGLIARQVLFLCGDPDHFLPPLMTLIPPDMAQSGYPVFFARQDLMETAPEYVGRVSEVVEFFYYRHGIYHLDSQETVRGMPIRSMVRAAIYDRLKHLYENLAPGLGSGTLADLRGAFAGQTAILAAAGPALPEALDFIRENQDRAVVIAVNNALKPLLAAGLEPHFVVINDTSVDSESSFTGLAPLSRTSLVAHCLSTTGAGIFPRAYFFGNFPGQPFKQREDLRLHGSVITTAFSLAECLGCTKAVLAGVQLASFDPLRLNYSRNSVHEGQDSGIRTDNLLHRFPELYPARAADGSLMYTTLNFYDAALWFADRIRLSRLEVVNICPQSILQGPGIEFDAHPRLPERPELAGLVANVPCRPPEVRQERLQGFLRQAMALWSGKQRQARDVITALNEGEEGLDQAQAFITACDADNTSFMVQRYEDFSNPHFHTLYFHGRDKKRGALYFCAYARRMSKTLLDILVAQHQAVAGLKSAGGRE